MIGADSLGYMEIDYLEGMAGGLPICKACFDGKYPMVIQMRIIYKMILKFIRYKRNNFVYTGCSRTFITIKKCIITKIPIAYLCNRYIYF